MKHRSLVKGDLSEAMVTAAFIAKGHCVSRPLDTTCPYDLVAEMTGKLKRIQIKTGRVRNGVVLFNTSRNPNGYDRRNYLKCKIHYFAVFVQKLNRVFLIPYADIKHLKGGASLRLKRPKNGQSDKIRFAKQYRFHKF